MPIKPPEKIKLTPKEELFVEYYCTTANGVAAEAARQAGYGDDLVIGSYKILKRPQIQKAIERWRESRRKTFWVSETEILERMWQEANYFDQGATHAGRISALVHLGKHLGLFSEKPKEAQGSGNTYNIINYSSATPMAQTDQKVIEAIKENESEIIEALEHQEDINVIDYRD